MPGHDETGQAEEAPGPFKMSHPWCAAFVGLATVSAVLPPRIVSEGPILVLENPKIEAVCGCNDIPLGAAGVMQFDVGPLILKDLVWVSPLLANRSRINDARTSHRGPEDKLGYAIRSPIVYERFVIVQKIFVFFVRVEQSGWTITPDSISASTTATHSNHFIA